MKSLKREYTMKVRKRQSILVNDILESSMCDSQHNLKTLDMVIIKNESENF